MPSGRERAHNQVVVVRGRGYYPGRITFSASDALTTTFQVPRDAARADDPCRHSGDRQRRAAVDEFPASDRDGEEALKDPFPTPFDN